ncbi:MAG: hypothetical protein CL868_00125 [Cytophagaceae bacterium]|nr:hypothetical protein [Flavobacteriaceae bacterium]MAZ25476.1 hypothetical protein [Cytophagaceae bacterium]|tara:strand:+ start:361 stop:930 length:570 start_codon:yes stop_codon:yes gene_type:complete
MKMKNKTSDLFIQIISVTIGVFLGYIISNWSANSKESEKLKSLVENIKAEIHDNQTKVSHVIDYHRMVKDSTSYYLNKEDLVNFKPTFFKGVNTITFSNSAYQTGIQTGLFNKMKLKNVQAINDIYTKQRAYKDFANLLMSGLITMDFDENKEAFRKIAIFLSISMTDVIIKEEQLLESYSKAVALIDK